MKEGIFPTLRSAFGDRLQENIPLSSYTAARIGGPADAILLVRSVEELAQTTETLWKMNIPFVLLGGGTNVLVSDKGLRSVVVINRARLVKFNLEADPPTVRSGSGTTLNDIAHRAARLGLTGFEWAANIPGTLGGAIYGNAGAFGKEISKNLICLDLIIRNGGQTTWSVNKMAYQYRSSVLKREHPEVVILSAELKLERGNSVDIKAKMKDFSARRRSIQPPGASMGSTFKNPSNDHAGRLIEAAGLKGKRIGNGEISRVHANFFINHGQTNASDMRALIELAQKTVAEKFNIILELEIELIGEW